jgi:hypothetical protein
MITMYGAIPNSPEMTLAADISASDAVFAVSDASKYSSLAPPYPLTIGKGEAAETVLVTGIDGNTLTVQRGFEGTAKPWSAGTSISRNFTAYDYNAIKENLESIFSTNYISMAALNLPEYQKYRKAILCAVKNFVFANPLDTEYAAYKDVLAASGSMTMSDGTVLRCVVDATYGAACDFIAYNADNDSFEIIRQIDSSGGLLAGIEAEPLSDTLKNQIVGCYLYLPVSEIQNIVDAKSTRQSISYKDFEAPLDGVSDDRYDVYMCHQFANLCGLAVECHAGTMNIVVSGWIAVDTDIDWSGMEIKIHNLNRLGLFWVKGEVWTVTETVNYAELTQDCSYCSLFADGAFPDGSSLKILRPEATKRVDNGVTTTESRFELVENITRGRLHAGCIDDAPQNAQYSVWLFPQSARTIKGCKLVINKTWSASPMYFMRLERSNCTVRDFIISPTPSTMQNTVYNGAVFTHENSNVITYENIHGANIAGKPTDTTPQGTSGYVFNLNCCNNITIANCHIGGYWGCMAAKGVKNLLVTGCVLNRIDIHDYFKDLFVTNCTIYEHGVQIGYGRGIVAITGCVFVTSKNYIVQLRTDYGGMFKGAIQINGVHILSTGTGSTFAIIDNTANFTAAALTANGVTSLQKPYLTIKTSFERIKGASAQTLTGATWASGATYSNTTITSFTA